MLRKWGKAFPKIQTFRGCSWVKNRILKVNLRVVALNSLEIAKIIAVLASTSWSLGLPLIPMVTFTNTSWSPCKCNFLVPEHGTRGSCPEGQLTQLCPKVQEQGANPQHLQLLSAPQGSLEVLEGRAQVPAEEKLSMAGDHCHSQPYRGWTLPHRGGAGGRKRRESGWRPESSSQGESN